MPKTGTLSGRLSPNPLGARWAWDAYAGHDVINCAAFFGDPNYDDVAIRRRRESARAPARHGTSALGLNVCLSMLAAGALGFLRLIERR